MQHIRRLALVLATYALIVIGFESMIGVLQPAPDGTLVITTADAEGTRNDRVLAKLESGDQLYIAANHWPRAWYEQALENPEVQVALDGKASSYRAVPVSGEEQARVDADNRLPVAFRILTGFPPRRFLRLDTP